jgi:hypothetical protein
MWRPWSKHECEGDMNIVVAATDAGLAEPESDRGAIAAGA